MLLQSYKWARIAWYSAGFIDSITILSYKSDWWVTEIFYSFSPISTEFSISDNSTDLVELLSGLETGRDGRFYWCSCPEILYGLRFGLIIHYKSDYWFNLIFCILVTILFIIKIKRSWKIIITRFDIMSSTSNYTMYFSFVGGRKRLINNSTYIVMANPHRIAYKSTAFWLIMNSEFSLTDFFISFRPTARKTKVKSHIEASAI